MVEYAVMKVVVGVSDARVSSDPTQTLATYSLGSCIGVAMYDPSARVAGLLHYQLPSSTLDPAKAKANPSIFADTGVEHLFRMMESAGAHRRSVRAKIAGAAQLINDGGLFSIGKRNYAAIRKILWQQGLFIDAEDVGGTMPRNLWLAVADGQVQVRTQSKTVTL